jgi:hypothetical protein
MPYDTIIFILMYFMKSERVLFDLSRL